MAHVTGVVKIYTARGYGDLMFEVIGTDSLEHTLVGKDKKPFKIYKAHTFIDIDCMRQFRRIKLERAAATGAKK